MRSTIARNGHQPSTSSKLQQTVFSATDTSWSMMCLQKILPLNTWKNGRKQIESFRIISTTKKRWWLSQCWDRTKYTTCFTNPCEGFFVRWKMISWIRHFQPLPKPEFWRLSWFSPSKRIQNVHQICGGDSGWPVVSLRWFLPGGNLKHTFDKRLDHFCRIKTGRIQSHEIVVH